MHAPKPGWTPTTAILSTLLLVTAAVPATLQVSRLLPEAPPPSIPASWSCSLPLTIDRSLCVQATSDLGLHRDGIHFAQLPSDRPGPLADEALAALVADLGKRLSSLETALDREIGGGLLDVLEVVGGQLAIAVVGVGGQGTGFRRDVVFAIDTRAREEVARKALSSLFESVRLTAQEVCVEESLFGEELVCSLEAGGKRVFLAWLDTVLVGAVTPDALAAVLKTFQAHSGALQRTL